MPKNENKIYIDPVSKQLVTNFTSNFSRGLAIFNCNDDLELSSKDVADNRISILTVAKEMEILLPMSEFEETSDWLYKFPFRPVEMYDRILDLTNEEDFQSKNLKGEFVFERLHNNKTLYLTDLTLPGFVFMCLRLRDDAILRNNRKLFSSSNYDSIHLKDYLGEYYEYSKRLSENMWRLNIFMFVILQRITSLYDTVDILKTVNKNSNKMNLEISDTQELDNFIKSEIKFLENRSLGNDYKPDYESFYNHSLKDQIRLKTRICLGYLDGLSKLCSRIEERKEKLRLKRKRLEEIKAEDTEMLKQIEELTRELKAFYTRDDKTSLKDDSYMRNDKHKQIRKLLAKIAAEIQ